MTKESKTDEAPAPKKIGKYEVTSVAELLEPHSILIYGPEKKGKTTLAGSISRVPGYERVLHLDVEKTGAATLARKYPTVQTISFDDHDVNGVVQVLNELRYGKEGDNWDVVILDTVSTLQKWFLDDDVARNPGKVKGKPEHSHWQTLLDLLMDTMWDLHYMKPVGITTYHEKTEQNELTKDIITSPHVQGSARHSVASVPDMVMNLRVNGAGERVLQMLPKRGMASGTRFGDVFTSNIEGNAKVNMTTIYNMLRAD